MKAAPADSTHDDYVNCCCYHQQENWSALGDRRHQVVHVCVCVCVCGQGRRRQSALPSCQRQQLDNHSRCRQSQVVVSEQRRKQLATRGNKVGGFIHRRDDARCAAACSARRVCIKAEGLLHTHTHTHTHSTRTQQYNTTSFTSSRLTTPRRNKNKRTVAKSAPHRTVLPNTSVFFFCGTIEKCRSRSEQLLWMKKNV